jgi:large subunit ribosomal protein L22
VVTAKTPTAAVGARDGGETGATMEVRASVTGVRVSPRKARLVVDAVRGKRVMDAIALTRFMPQKTAADVGKLLQSVAASAENNYDMDPEDLWIKAIYADDGPSFRRFKAKARGRVGRIIRRNTHLTVIAEERRS